MESMLVHQYIKEFEYLRYTIKILKAISWDESVRNKIIIRKREYRDKWKLICTFTLCIHCMWLRNCSRSLM